MSQAVAPVGGLVRLSIASDDRRLDVGVPALVPLIELIPGFARNLGLLDPVLAQSGYTLRRADGSDLDPARSSLAQGLQDGELLTLVPLGLGREARVYDDVVEAVIDATAEGHREWTPRDSTRTALALSLTFLGLCVVLLAAAGRELGVGAIVAGGAAAVLLAAAGVLPRLGQAEAGRAFGLASAVFAALGGYLAVPYPGPLGWPLAAAGGGALLIGAVAFVLLRPEPELQLIPIVVGGVLGVVGVISALLPGSDTAVAALALAVVATAVNALPWLALSSTRIRVISPQSDVEVFAAPNPIDADDLARRAAAGQRVLLAMRVALGLLLVGGAVSVAATGPAGVLLCVLASAGLMFQSRRIPARSGVLAVMVPGAVGLAATGLVALFSQPGLRPALLVGLLAITAVLVTLSLLDPRARVRLARLADGAEIAVLALLLPLGVLSAGLL